MPTVLDSAQQARFAEELDATLCRLNDDYADPPFAGGYGMDAARVRFLPTGAFAAWMKSRGKLGGPEQGAPHRQRPGALRRIAPASPMPAYGDAKE